MASPEICEWAIQDMWCQGGVMKHTLATSRLTSSGISRCNKIAPALRSSCTQMHTVPIWGHTGPQHAADRCKYNMIDARVGPM